MSGGRWKIRCLHLSVMSCADPGTGWLELFWCWGMEGKALSVRRSLSLKPLPLWWTTKWAPIFLLPQLLEKSLTSYFASKRGRAECITLWRKSAWCGWFREKKGSRSCVVPGRQRNLKRQHGRLQVWRAALGACGGRSCKWLETASKKGGERQGLPVCRWGILCTLIRFVLTVLWYILSGGII